MLFGGDRSPDATQIREVALLSVVPTKISEVFASASKLTVFSVSPSTPPIAHCSILYNAQKDTVGNGIPTLVPMEVEQTDTPVLEYFRNQDLIIVPATQISPSGLCTPIAEQQELPPPPVGARQTQTVVSCNRNAGS